MAEFFSYWDLVFEIYLDNKMRASTAIAPL
jgi:hypothetical protein